MCLVKCKKSHLATLIIGASCLFKLLLDKTDSSCHNTAEAITFTYFLAYSFLFEGQGQSPYLFTLQTITLVFYVMVFSKEDRTLIEQLQCFKGYGAKKLAKD